jgi:hypothetical protein
VVDVNFHPLIIARFIVYIRSRDAIDALSTHEELFANIPSNLYYKACSLVIIELDFFMYVKMYKVLV